jgi:hypothetical protein
MAGGAAHGDAQRVGRWARVLVGGRDWRSGFISRGDVADFLVRSAMQAFIHKTPSVTGQTPRSVPKGQIAAGSLGRRKPLSTRFRAEIEAGNDNRTDTTRA